MNIEVKRTARLLIDVNCMIFGLAVFNLLLAWLRSPEWYFHRNVFMAILLLASSILLILNTSWSNLFAAILSGYLPIEIAWAFWMLAHNAEVPAFSYKHFSYFFRDIEVEGGLVLLLALTSMIFARAVFVVIRSIPVQMTTNDA